MIKINLFLSIWPMSAYADHHKLQLKKIGPTDQALIKGSQSICILHNHFF